MSEQVNPLPTDHAFVLQLLESHGRPGPCREGRVEHLASGEATRFSTTEELWEFVDKVLTESMRVLIPEDAGQQLLTKQIIKKNIPTRCVQAHRASGTVSHRPA